MAYSHGPRMPAPLRWILGIGGLLGFITLMTPPLYYAKYALFDAPAEARIAQTGSTWSSAEASPVRVSFVALYERQAKSAPEPDDRAAAINALAKLILLPGEQMTHPFECFHAKLAIESALTDPNPMVRQTAQSLVLRVAAHGAVIRR